MFLFCCWLHSEEAFYFCIVFYCQRCKANRPPEILPPVRTSLFGYFTVENQIVTRIKGTANSKAEDLQRIPYSKRALLKEGVIYVASVFKTCKAACGYRLPERCHKMFHQAHCHEVWFAHVRSVVNNISTSALHKIGLHNCNTFRNKLLTNSNKFIHIVTLRHNNSILLWESVCKKSWKSYAKQCWRQDAALFDASANWKSFRHGPIKLGSCLHVLVERYKDGK